MKTTYTNGTIYTAKVRTSKGKTLVVSPGQTVNCEDGFTKRCFPGFSPWTYI